ncbi:hypothetical protein [Thermococcus gorgonarius]|nr:hypothetical protein [Thermococcus gorgonarius]
MKVLEVYTDIPDQKHGLFSSGLIIVAGKNGHGTMRRKHLL